MALHAIGSVNPSQTNKDNKGFYINCLLLRKESKSQSTHYALHITHYKCYKTRNTNTCVSSYPHSHEL